MSRVAGRRGCRARGVPVLALLAALRLSVLPLGLAACTTQPPPYEQRVHVVRAGDTLYKIAWQYRLDQRDLARWNGLKDPDFIRVGQRLRLSPPPKGATARAPSPAPTGSNPSARGTAPAQSKPPSSGTGPPTAAPSKAPAPPLPNLPPPVWAWPADGPVVARFGSHAGIDTGVAIGGREGAPVHAAAAGRVVYAGSGLVGYGQLVIIKHNETYLTAYGYNSRLMVVQGQDVARGQTIAAMGLGPERQPRLHFEIRRNGVPMDPLQFFPGR